MSRRILDVGERAVLVECVDACDALDFARAVREYAPVPVTEVVAGARTVLLRIDRALSSRERATVAALDPASAGLAPASTDTLDLEVIYDGADLDEVASLLGVSAEEVVARHTGQAWTVGFCGFAPGFGYLFGEHQDLRVPRRSSPRTQVPAGSVALADSWCGVYPRRSPGGWQLIGHTSQSIWDPARRPPALLRPGVTVRFRAVGRE